MKTLRIYQFDAFLNETYRENCQKMHGRNRGRNRGGIIEEKI